MARSKTQRRLSKSLKARLHFAARFAVIVLLSTFLVLNQDQRAAIAQVLSDPMSLIANRSPGERQQAALRQTKVRHDVKLPRGEKLLSEGRVMDEADLANEPGFFAGNDETPPVSDIALPTGGKGPEAEMPAVARGGGGGGRGFFGGVGGGPGGGGAGGGGGKDGDNELCIPGQKDCGEGTTEPSGDPKPPTPIIGVPEPETWAMMLVGFFALGAIVRRAKSGRARADAAQRPHTD